MVGVSPSERAILREIRWYNSAGVTRITCRELTVLTKYSQATVVRGVSVLINNKLVKRIGRKKAWNRCLVAKKASNV